ncbi:MAG: hypothetical protein ACRD2B_10000 [Terriglobia bacterium]
MYKTLLVNKSIEDGDKLVRRLEEKNFPISAAFWRYLDQEMLWRLVIVSPVVAQNGPLRTYIEVSKAVDELGGSVQFGISDITVMSPSSSQFRDLRRTIEGAGVGRVRVASSSEAHQGLAFEDFYLYRWDPNRL